MSADYLAVRYRPTTAACRNAALRVRPGPRRVVDAGARKTHGDAAGARGLIVVPLAHRDLRHEVAVGPARAGR
ncbi:hypothetical protein [Mycobacteroides abscessus]|uniref:hypothetical protein n=1 Tax=Mycobacteroides abscessus TaxID=36809 RepID=UPI00130000F6|nr:hypothetical protein [Mycobacteroides abscessus]